MNKTNLYEDFKNLFRINLFYKYKLPLQVNKTTRSLNT